MGETHGLDPSSRHTLFLLKKSSVVPTGAVMAHTTLVLMGSAQVPFGGNLGGVAWAALFLWAVCLGYGLWLPHCP